MLYDEDDDDDRHVRVCGLYHVCSMDVGIIERGGMGGLLLVRLEFYTYDFSVSLFSIFNLNRI